MKTLKTILAVAMVLLITACGKKISNGETLNSKEFVNINDDTKHYIDRAMDITRKSHEDNCNQTTDSFWTQYLQLQDEAEGVIYYFNQEIKNNSVEVPESEIKAAENAIIDYYLAKVDEAYNKYDSHLIPTSNTNVSVEYLSNNRFKDIKVKISYYCQEPEIIFDQKHIENRHLVSLLPHDQRTTTMPTYIAETGMNAMYKRSMLIIIKPASEISDSTYVFETTLPGRDFMENGKNKPLIGWCNFSSINIATPMGPELGKYASRMNLVSDYNPTVVLISDDGKTIEIDDK